MEAPEVYKTCKVCCQAKLATTEFFYGNGQGYLSSECKPCRKGRASAWKKANPDAVVASRAKSAPANRERTKKWARTNPERALDAHRHKRAARPEHYRALFRQWLLDNPEKARYHALESANRRRARIYNQTVGSVDYVAILMEYGMVCHICGDDIPEGNAVPGLALWFDHVIPLARGGLHEQSNLKPSHADCNRRKSARLDYQ